MTPVKCWLCRMPLKPMRMTTCELCFKINVFEFEGEVYHDVSMHP